MIISKMSYQEIMYEIDKDIPIIDRYIQSHFRKVFNKWNKAAKRQTGPINFGIFDYRSPSKNTYIIVISGIEKHVVYSLNCVYYDRENRLGMVVIPPNAKSRYCFFYSHFFDRYNERYLGMEGAGKIEIMKGFVKNNNNAGFFHTTEVDPIVKKKHPECNIMTRVNGGIGLGVDEGNYLVLKTFISDDLAKGSEVDLIDRSKNYNPQLFKSKNNTTVNRDEKIDAIFNTTKQVINMGIPSELYLFISRCLIYDFTVPMIMSLYNKLKPYIPSHFTYEELNEIDLTTLLNKMKNLHIFENKTNKKMKKNRIRLTESQLHQIIKESVNRLLYEYKNSSTQIYNDTLNKYLSQGYDSNNAQIEAEYAAHKYGENKHQARSNNHYDLASKDDIATDEAIHNFMYDKMQGLKKQGKWGQLHKVHHNIDGDEWDEEYIEEPEYWPSPRVFKKYMELHRT